VRTRNVEVITFKAEPALLAAMRGIPNRSEFIRAAVLVALENLCPVCRGTGTLTPRQREHWDEFARGHSLVECQDCHEIVVVCESKARGK